MYIYGLIDPRTQEVRYVGKTKDLQERYRIHLYERRKNHKCNWIEYLQRQGLKPQLIILEEVPETQWQEAERLWIGHFQSKGIRLTNGREGGTGGQMTDEVRRKISLSHRGMKHSEESKARIRRANTGRTLTEEQRNKLSESTKGHKRCVGRKYSEETKRKIGLAHKGQKMSEEQKQKISLALRGRQFSEETRRTFGLAWKGRKHTDVSRQKMSLARKGRRLSEEHKRKLGLKSKAYWDGPEGMAARLLRSKQMKGNKNAVKGKTRK